VAELSMCFYQSEIHRKPSAMKHDQFSTEYDNLPMNWW